MPGYDDHKYAVGCGKPPEHSRFVKGRSGSPKGRPKGSKNFSTLLSDALNEPVVVNENGKRRRITKREAVLKQLVNKAAAGNPKAIQLLLSEMRLVERREQGTAEAALFDEADREVIRQLYVRLRDGHEQRVGKRDEEGSNRGSNA
jgi:hypothetical protein